MIVGEMGRGGNDDLQGVEPRNGELPLIDADRLDDHTGDATEMSLDSDGRFGDPDDDRAIRRVIVRLRRIPAAVKLSEEELEDRAIELYNRTCGKIRAGDSDPDQLAKAASLFGESPEHLRERLLGPREDERAGAGSGPIGLLANLSNLSPSE